MNGSRRQIMQILGLSPVIAQSASKELAAMVSSPAIKAAAFAIGGFTGVGSDSSEGPPVGYGESPLTKLLGRQVVRRLDKLKQRAEGESWARKQIQKVRFDPDISALKSVSRTYKARMQLEKEIEEMSFFNSVTDMMWPD